MIVVTKVPYGNYCTIPGSLSSIAKCRSLVIWCSSVSSTAVLVRDWMLWVPMADVDLQRQTGETGETGEADDDEIWWLE